MDDERHDDDGPTPFRPWRASGVPHPGADRPDAPDVSAPSDRPGVAGPPPRFTRYPEQAYVRPGVVPPQYASPTAPPVGAGGPQYPAPPPAPGYPPYGYPARVEHVHINASGGVSGAAVASLVLGILSFLIPWFGLLSFLAIGFGIWGRSSTRMGRSSGDGLAVAGIILGITSVVLYAIVFRMLFFWFLFR